MTRIITTTITEPSAPCPAQPERLPRRGRRARAGARGGTGARAERLCRGTARQLSTALCCAVLCCALLYSTRLTSSPLHPSTPTRHAAATQARPLVLDRPPERARGRWSARHQAWTGTGAGSRARTPSARCGAHGAEVRRAGRPFCSSAPDPEACEMGAREDAVGSDSDSEPPRTSPGAATAVA
ncbi:hypothetical protein JHW43_003021 [Diplocarpon mali]|nr:hypothetical protein JHW43_003021 [Diplocarpon mali]